MPEYVYRVEDHRVFLLLPLVWWHQKRVVRPLHYCNDLLASDNCGATERGRGSGAEREREDGGTNCRLDLSRQGLQQLQQRVRPAKNSPKSDEKRKRKRKSQRCCCCCCLMICLPVVASTRASASVSALCLCLIRFDLRSAI